MSEWLQVARISSDGEQEDDAHDSNELNVPVVCWKPLDPPTLCVPARNSCIQPSIRISFTTLLSSAKGSIKNSRLLNDLHLDLDR